MWLICITFERGGPKFSYTTARALAYCTVVQQRQLRAKWLVCSTRFFCVCEFIKTESQLTLLHVCALDECSIGGIWKFRTSSFKCYVDHSHTMYSSGNTDVRNCVHLSESHCIYELFLLVCEVTKLCVVCAVLVPFIHALVWGAWLLSFSFKHNIWRSLDRAVC
jgi:hypothetical protein